MVMLLPGGPSKYHQVSLSDLYTLLKAFAQVRDFANGASDHWMCFQTDTGRCVVTQASVAVFLHISYQNWLQNGNAM